MQKGPFPIFNKSQTSLNNMLLALRHNQLFGTLDVSLVRNCLSVVNDVSKGIYPVAKKYTTTIFGEHKILVAMTMPKDKAIDRTMRL